MTAGARPSDGVAARPRRLVLEVRVFPNRVEVNDIPGWGEGARLVRLLEKLGIRTDLRYRSPCG